MCIFIVFIYSSIFSSYGRTWMWHLIAKITNFNLFTELQNHCFLANGLSKNANGYIPIPFFAWWRTLKPGVFKCYASDVGEWEMNAKLSSESLSNPFRYNSITMETQGNDSWSECIGQISHTLSFSPCHSLTVPRMKCELFQTTIVIVCKRYFMKYEH